MAVQSNESSPDRPGQWWYPGETRVSEFEVSLSGGKLIHGVQAVAHPPSLQSCVALALADRSELESGLSRFRNLLQSRRPLRSFRLELRQLGPASQQRVEGKPDKGHEGHSARCHESTRDRWMP